MRVALGFILAPIFGPLVVAAYSLWFGGLEGKYIVGFFLNMAMVSYIVAVVAGVPAFLMLKSWKVKLIFGYLLGGILLSLLPFIFFFSMSSVPGELLASCIVVGAVNGLAFWLLAVCKSNQSLKKGPREQRATP
jgi:hypothetical protein